MLSPGREKIGTMPCRKRREGRAPSLAHATIRGLRVWYSGKRAPACPCRGQGPLGTGNKIRDVHSPISAHARQKSTEYCVQVASKGESASPDWIQYCFSTGVRSFTVRVLCKKPVKSARKDCSISSALPESKVSTWESGKHLQRRVHSAQLSNGG